MSLTAISSLESARRKFFLNSTCIMSRRQESNVFGLKEAEMSLTTISLLKWARGKFYMNLTHDMFKSTQSNFFGLKIPK